MASLVAKHPGCGGNGIPATKSSTDRRMKCLRCGVLFTMPEPDVADLVGNAKPHGAELIDPLSIDCRYERSDTTTWIQEYDAILHETADAVLFKLPGRDEGTWVPKSVLISVNHSHFECATWFGRKEIDV